MRAPPRGVTSAASRVTATKRAMHVACVRHAGLHADPTPSMWIPHAQGATGAIHLVVRASGEPALLQRSVRQALREINGSMPLGGCGLAGRGAVPALP